MIKITPQTTATALVNEIERQLLSLDNIVSEVAVTPDVPSLVSAVQIAAAILTNIDALDATALSGPSTITFRSVLARLARAKDKKAVKRAVSDLRSAVHPIIVRAKPYDPDDYPF